MFEKLDELYNKEEGILEEIKELKQNYTIWQSKRRSRLNYLWKKLKETRLQRESIMKSLSIS